MVQLVRELAEPVLRRALEGDVTPEMQRRLLDLLEQAERSPGGFRFTRELSSNSVMKKAHYAVILSEANNFGIS